MRNRSVPDVAVVPVLGYPDVGAAVDWLCAAFGFTERLRIGTHRAQLTYGDGAVIVTDGAVSPASVHVRVEDADAHCAVAEAHGARIVSPPEEYPFGERQYSALDLAGHAWTFSQSVADVDPRSWGATLPD